VVQAGSSTAATATRTRGTALVCCLHTLCGSGYRAVLHEHQVALLVTAVYRLCFNFRH